MPFTKSPDRHRCELNAPDYGVNLKMAVKDEREDVILVDGLGRFKFRKGSRSAFAAALNAGQFDGETAKVAHEHDPWALLSLFTANNSTIWQDRSHRNVALALNYAYLSRSVISASLKHVVEVRAIVPTATHLNNVSDKLRFEGVRFVQADHVPSSQESAEALLDNQVIIPDFPQAVEHHLDGVYAAWMFMSPKAIEFMQNRVAPVIKRINDPISDGGLVADTAALRAFHEGVESSLSYVATMLLGGPRNIAAMTTDPTETMRQLTYADGHTQLFPSMHDVLAEQAVGVAFQRMKAVEALGIEKPTKLPTPLHALERPGGRGF